MVARRPEDFAGGDAPLDGGEGWEIEGVVFKRNPKRLLTRDDQEMVRIWSWTRVGDMGGARPLPDAGGIQDQAAVMMDAIGIMDSAFARLKDT
jgi:hypothetical protein